MTRNSALKIANPVLGLLLVNQALTALLRGVMPRTVFEMLHQGGGIALVAVALLHVTLNWNWIKANFFAKSS